MNRTGPRAALVHSVIASGLADPTRLRSWAADTTTLANLGIDPTTMDLEALSKFAGLGEKVRHNRTRAMLPMTFRLLHLLGLDIDLFRAYALSARNPGRGSAPLDRVDALAGFVEDWAGDDTDRTLVRDMVRHEHALTHLQMMDPPVDDHRDPTTRPELTPTGTLLVRQLSTDPQQLVEALRQQHPQLSQLDRGSWTFVYQRAAGHPIRVLGVDPAVADLLLLVGDGVSMTSLAERLRSRADDPALVMALDQLVDAGLLTRGR
ncbi:MAG TPA: hypothetical protein VIT65_25940 [Microlunatus sp.]